MLRAILKFASLTTDKVDAENGVIYGARIAEVGKLARFKNADGKNVKFKVTPEHITAFLAHAGNRAITSHWTHDYLNEDRDNLHSTTGALKALRRDESGNLVGDYHLAPTEHKQAILWAAQNNPEGMMLSAVFSYAKDDPTCMPQSLDAVDVVETGAATTALLSEDTNKTPNMDIAEFIAMLDDPKVKDAIKALVKAHKDPAESTDAEDAALEKDAGVTADDKKTEDAAMSRAGRMAIQFHRAALRIAKTNGAIELAKLSGEIKVQSEASVVAALGASPFSAVAAAKKDGDEWENKVQAHLAAMPAGKKDRGTAIMRASRDNPDLYNAARTAGKL